MEISQSTLWKQRGNIFKRMTTIFTISTQTFSRTTSLRCMLGVACLLVMVSGCRSAVTTQASVALNTYQTPETLPAGNVGGRVFGLGFTSSMGAALESRQLQFTPAAMGTGGVDIEVGLGKGWDIGCMARYDANFLDASASIRPYAKVRFTEDNAPLTAAILFGSEFIQGSSSNSSQIYVPVSLFYQPMPLIPLFDTTITSSASSLSSNALRISVSVPIIFAAGKYNNTTFILHPGLHYWEQHITRSETITTKRYSANSIPTGAPQIVSENRNNKDISRYVIPSISLSVRGQVDGYMIQPEITFAPVGRNLLWNFGLGFYFGKFGE